MQTLAIMKPTTAKMVSQSVSETQALFTTHVQRGRRPQSVQSVPYTQSAHSAPGPPSSHCDIRLGTECLADEG